MQFHVTIFTRIECNTAIESGFRSHFRSGIQKFCGASAEANFAAPSKESQGDDESDIVPIGKLSRERPLGHQETITRGCRAKSVDTKRGELILINTANVTGEGLGKDRKNDRKKELGWWIALPDYFSAISLNRAQLRAALAIRGERGHCLADTRARTTRRHLL